MQVVRWFIWLPLLLFVPLRVAEAAEKGAAAAVFGPGGAGFAIVELLLLAAFGALVYYIVSALQYQQIANMVKLVTVFGCISIVISEVWRAVSAVARVFHVQL